MNKKIRNVYCKHIKENKALSMYIYHLIGMDINICKDCERKLRKQIITQSEIEESL